MHPENEAGTEGGEIYSKSSKVKKKHTLAGFLEVSLAGIFHSNLEPCPQWEMLQWYATQQRDPLQRARKAPKEEKGATE